MVSKAFLTIVGLLALTTASSITGYYILVNINDDKAFNVTKVFDGDTIEIETGEVIRLLGINAPESNEHYYKEAKDSLSKLIEGKYVKLEKGPENEDKYNRLLRYVFVNEKLVNAELVKQGYATVYIISPEEKYYLELKKAENDAKNNKLGLWDVGEGTVRCVEIDVFNYDAEGNDNENLNGEYVTFQNNCGNTVNMAGWTVKDAGTAIYTFKSFVFNASSKLTLYSGSGSDDLGNLYWNRKMAVWNNGGDTLFLRDDKGNLVLSYSYP